MKNKGFIKKFGSFAASSVAYIASGFHKTSPEGVEMRKAICQGCEYYFKNEDNPVCLHCGCFLNIKHQWATEKCPIDKWPAEIMSSYGCGSCGADKLRTNEAN
jgi:hypothetical protein